jgi:hypothetical protein
MNKLKYITAVLIAVAGLGLQQAQASLTAPQYFEVNSPIGGGTQEANYLIANGYMDASCQYLGKFNAGGTTENGAINISQYVTVTFSADGQSADVSWNLTGSGFLMCGILIKDGTVNQPNQLYGFYGVTADQELIGSGTVSFADFDRQISHISFFGHPGGQVPDGGTTVMLLGAALGSLGMARRFLKG